MPLDRATHEWDRRSWQRIQRKPANVIALGAGAWFAHPACGSEEEIDTLAGRRPVVQNADRLQARRIELDANLLATLADCRRQRRFASFKVAAHRAVLSIGKAGAAPPKQQNLLLAQEKNVGSEGKQGMRRHTEPLLALGRLPRLRDHCPATAKRNGHEQYSCARLRCELPAAERSRLANRLDPAVCDDAQLPELKCGLFVAVV